MTRPSGLFSQNFGLFCCSRLLFVRFGKQINRVDRLNGQAPLLQTSADLHQTARIPGDDQVSSRGFNVANFPIQETLRHFWFGEVVSSGAATTPI